MIDRVYKAVAPPSARRDLLSLYKQGRDPDYTLLPFQKMEESIRSRRKDGAHSNLHKEKSDPPAALKKKR